MTRRIAAASALAALALTTAPAVAPAAAKRKQPASWVKAQKDAKALFAVLRRPAKASDKAPKSSATPAAAISRRLGTLTGKSFYLLVRGTKVCLSVTFSTGRPVGEYCVTVAKVKARQSLPKALGAASASTFDYVVAVPDGATVARTISGVSTPQTVKSNAAFIAGTALGGSVDVTFAGGTVLSLPLGFSLTGLPTS